VLIGGFVTTTCIGGYTNKRALTVCFFVALLASLSALPIPWINNLVGVIICLWLVLFFGGFIMPNLTGILLNSVPPKERAIANSVANFFYNLLGYLPAPFLYGLVV
jgi:MFS family permease